MTLKDIQRNVQDESRLKEMYFMNSSVRRFVRKQYGKGVEELLWECLRFEVSKRPDYSKYFRLISELRMQYLIEND